MRVMPFHKLQIQPTPALEELFSLLDSPDNLDISPTYEHSFALTFQLIHEIPRRRRLKKP